MAVKIFTLAISFLKLSVDSIYLTGMVLSWYYHNLYRWGAKSLRLYLT